MPDNIKNATSDRIAKYDKLDELEAIMQRMIDEGKNHGLQWALINAENRRELRKINSEFNKEFTQGLNKFIGRLNSIGNELKRSIDQTISQYVGSIEKLSYSLNGNLRNYSDITSNLNKILNGQNLVSQEGAFKNLTDIVTKGIVNNPEQKAFLQSLSEDLGMEFKVTTDTMRQLIRIQGEDSTANRMAIEYSLNEFLVQNYRTGEYIRDGFQDVSKALLESQALMTSSVAASYEATIQTWMGSLYSNGVSSGTVKDLAKAINAVGSGDIEGLGSGISNLVLMGAARSGLDYGELLNRGFQGNDVNRLMQGISGYLTEISGSSSNVVLNQLGKIFGVSVTDLAAIRNNGISNVAGIGANANTESMLNGITGLVPGVNRLMNGINNFSYGWGANLASNPEYLLQYEIARNFIEPIGNILGNGVSSVGSLFGPIGSIVGGVLGGASSLLLGNASLLPLFMANQGQGNLANLFNGSLFGGLKNPQNGVSAFNIWQALGNGGDGLNNTTIVSSGAGTSGSFGISKNGGSGLLDNFKGSLNNLGIEEATTGDEITVDEHIGKIDDTVQTISDILDKILSAMPSNSSTSYNYSSSGGPIYGSQTR